MKKEVKSGYQTTEFWLALLGNVVATGLTLGVIGPDAADVVLESGDTAVQSIAVIIETVAGPLLMAVTNGAYALSRGKAKSGAK